jgi:hypothetical protein
MNQYGKDCSDVVQVPKMIQRLTLQIIESVKDLKSAVSFTVDLFPNELPDFLVLQHVFEAQKNQFETQSWEGKRVQIKTKKGTEHVIVTQTNSPLEPTLYPNSLWQNVVVNKAPIGNAVTHRSRQRADS